MILIIQAETILFTAEQRPNIGISVRLPPTILLFPTSPKQWNSSFISTYEELGKTCQTQREGMLFTWSCFFFNLLFTCKPPPVGPIACCCPVLPCLLGPSGVGSAGAKREQP